MATTYTNSTDSTQSTQLVIPELNIVFVILVPVLSLLAVLGNLLIIVAFWKVPSLREKSSEFLILNLSFVDLITGLVTLPLFSPLYIIRGYWPLGEHGCRMLAIFLNLTIHSSLFNLVAISIDRLLLVLKEYPKYLKIQSQHRINMTIAICWILAALTVVPQQGMWDVAQKIDESAANIDFDNYCLSPARRLKAYSLTLFLALYFTPVILVCGSSISFLYLLRRRLTKTIKLRDVSRCSTSVQQQENPIENQPASSTTTSHSTTTTSNLSTRSRYIKPAVSLIALVSAMAICMLPYCFYVLTIELLCQQCNDLDVLYGLLLLQFCNACLDPFFYGLTQKKIRQFYCSCLLHNRVVPR